MKIRKKPVIVDGEQWHKHGDNPSVVPYPEDAIKHSITHLCEKCHKPLEEHGWINTLEGGHIVCLGDWIITGVKGEKYPCKPDIFPLTYEFVDAKTLVPEPKSLIELCHNLLELARHGDYSNGNVGQGMDEGQVKAAQMLANYEMQLGNFEKIK